MVRRAERLTTELASREPVNPVAIQYLNRLSDHLFVLARHLNDKGAADVLWVPGANRQSIGDGPRRRGPAGIPDPDLQPCASPALPPQSCSSRSELCAIAVRSIDDRRSRWQGR